MLPQEDRLTQLHDQAENWEVVSPGTDYNHGALLFHTRYVLFDILTF
jgi:hypothetical protein